MIRKASKKDIKRILELLHQVNMVHHVLRPDLFKPYTTKYNEQELDAMLSDNNKPIFVYDDEEVLGYAFCQPGTSLWHSRYICGRYLSVWPMS